MNYTKTRDPNSIKIKNAKVVFIDTDNNYYCFDEDFGSETWTTIVEWIEPDLMYYDIGVTSAGYFVIEKEDGYSERKLLGCE